MLVLKPVLLTVEFREVEAEKVLEELLWWEDSIIERRPRPSRGASRLIRCMKHLERLGGYGYAMRLVCAVEKRIV